MTVLYRAAQVERPYFGQGSHWTPSLRHARRFRLLLEENESRLQEQYQGPYAVYRAEVDPHGEDWRRFMEGPFEGEVWIQYQYLGSDPITAELVEQ